jgi:hypothetical protein
MPGDRYYCLFVFGMCTINFHITHTIPADVKLELGRFTNNTDLAATPRQVGEDVFDRCYGEFKLNPRPRAVFEDRFLKVKARYMHICCRVFNTFSLSAIDCRLDELITHFLEGLMIPYSILRAIGNPAGLL